jgi:hypothetical protein
VITRLVSSRGLKFSTFYGCSKDFIDILFHFFAKTRVDKILEQGTNSMEQSSYGEAYKKFSTLCGTQRLSTMLVRACHFVPIVGQMTLVHNGISLPGHKVAGV